MNNYNFPFQKYEIDLSNQTLENRLINLSGNILIIPNNIIPIGYDSTNSTFVKPTIKFNTLDSPAIELQPFSVFEVNFERIFLNSFHIFYSTPDPVEGSKISLLSSNIENINLLNFRRFYPFKISTTQSLNLTGTKFIRILVPSGAKNVSIALNYTTDANFTAIITGYIYRENGQYFAGNQKLVQETITNQVSNVIYNLECADYDYIEIEIYNITGTYLTLDYSLIFTE